MKTLDPPGDPLGGLASLDHWSIAARRASSTDGHRLELVSEFQTQDTSSHRTRQYRITVRTSCDSIRALSLRFRVPRVPSLPIARDTV